MFGGHSSGDDGMLRCLMGWMSGSTVKHLLII